MAVVVFTYWVNQSCCYGEYIGLMLMGCDVVYTHFSAGQCPCMSGELNDATNQKKRRSKLAKPGVLNWPSAALQRRSHRDLARVAGGVAISVVLTNAMPVPLATIP